MGNNTQPKCSCVNCRALGVHGFAVRRRGNNNAFLCEFHTRSLQSYFDENELRLGTIKANRLTYSIELETMRPTFQARLELCIAGFLPTSDSTVDAEFKSPIYEGANALKAYLPSIQWMCENGLITIDDECGTHFHVGHHDYINRRFMSYIRRFYHSLFVPLSNVLSANPEKATEIFGREFGYWSAAINERSNALEHTNFINVQHDNTLEFRRMFFANAAQYSRGIDFCREVTEKVVNTFCAEVERLGLTEGDTLTTAQKDALKKAADKAARQMVKAFEKA